MGKTDKNLNTETWRPVGGIEPLRLSSSTGLKPALRTTEDQLGALVKWINLYLNFSYETIFYLWLRNCRFKISTILG